LHGEFNQFNYPGFYILCKTQLKITENKKKGFNNHLQFQKKKYLILDVLSTIKKNTYESFSS